MDRGGPAFDHHSRNGGRGICQKTCPRGRAFEQFFQKHGLCPGLNLPGGCSRLELTHTLRAVHTRIVSWKEYPGNESNDKQNSPSPLLCFDSEENTLDRGFSKGEDSNKCRRRKLSRGLGACFPNNLWKFESLKWPLPECWEKFRTRLILIFCS